MGKYIEIRGSIVHVIMSNNNVFVRGSVLDTNLENDETMKYFDDSIIDEIQGKLSWVVVNYDYDGDLKFGEVMEKTESQDTGVGYLKDTDDDIIRSGNYYNDI